MKCPNCGKEITEGKKFCGFCGAKIAIQSPVPVKEEKPVIKEKEKPVKVVKEKTLKKEGKHPKWIIPAIVGLIIIATVLVYVFIINPTTPSKAAVQPSTSSSSDSSNISKPTSRPTSKPTDRPEPSGSSVSFSDLEGTWHGEVITLIFNDMCGIDVLCGEFIINDSVTGGLVITYKEGNEFGFYNPEGTSEVYEEWIRYIDDRTLEWYSNSEYGEGHEFLTKE